jgi:glycosyltransferase involved in cell wall biosynthesis
VKIFKQKKRGKADAVRTGFAKASNDILMIYDADRTVDGGDLIKFYNVLASGIGEFANGSRLVYPMEKQAMQTLNKIGNKVFSMIFTWILGQKFKDTLCGTKAFFRIDYMNFKYSKSDPFGDFDLIFGAVRNNLKVVEIPVRYKEREYGTTNIRRFKHGLMLIGNVISAFTEFRAW